MKAASLMPSDVPHTNENILAAMRKLRYPVMATLKMDGIRGVRANGTLLSCQLKQIPNVEVRNRAMKLPGGYDMELFNPDLPYNDIESIVMSKEHPDSSLIQFHVLDDFAYDMPYDMRMQMLLLDRPAVENMHFQHPRFIFEPEDLLAYFLCCEEQNGEGICFRTPDSPYKCGRSTLKEQYLVKLARYARQEVRIIGFNEQFENGNGNKYNELGLMKRQTLGYKMYGKNTLGSFVVETLEEPRLIFTVGSGMSDKVRKMVWDAKSTFMGKLITIKHKPHGKKIKPRSPIFVGFRSKGI